MSEMLDSIGELVELGGDKIKMHKPECDEWHLTHENCLKCPFELGCSKQVSIGLTVMASNEYNSDKIQEIIDKMLSAKTVKELKAIPVPSMEY